MDDDELYPRIPQSEMRLTAAGDVRGGGTGREYLVNLHNESTQSWDKWYHSGARSSWIQIDFTSSQSISRYGLCSANDSPHRDPAVFELRGKLADCENPDEAWVTLHSVQQSPFSERWQWVWFDVSSEAGHQLFDSLRLEIQSVRQERDGIQLGHLHLRKGATFIQY